MIRPVSEVPSDKLKGGYKDDEDKVRFDLMAWDAIEEASKIMGGGSVKYSPYNWAKGMDWHRPFRASINHGQAFWRGEDRDPETGQLHTAHAMCNNMFLTSYQLRGGNFLRFDNRPHKLIGTDPAQRVKCCCCQKDVDLKWNWCPACGSAINA